MDINIIGDEAISPGMFWRSVTYRWSGPRLGLLFLANTFQRDAMMARKIRVWLKVGESGHKTNRQQQHRDDGNIPGKFIFLTVFEWCQR